MENNIHDAEDLGLNLDPINILEVTQINHRTSNVIVTPESIVTHQAVHFENFNQLLGATRVNIVTPDIDLQHNHAMPPQTFIQWLDMLDNLPINNVVNHVPAFANAIIPPFPVIDLQNNQENFDFLGANVHGSWM